MTLETCSPTQQAHLTKYTDTCQYVGDPSIQETRTSQLTSMEVSNLKVLTLTPTALHLTALLSLKVTDKRHQQITRRENWTCSPWIDWQQERAKIAQSPPGMHLFITMKSEIPLWLYKDYRAQRNGLHSTFSALHSRSQFSSCQL